jgi:hypothetical protein
MHALASNILAQLYCTFIHSKNSTQAAGDQTYFHRTWVGTSCRPTHGGQSQMVIYRAAEEVWSIAWARATRHNVDLVGPFGRLSCATDPLTCEPRCSQCLGFCADNESTWWFISIKKIDLYTKESRNLFESQRNSITKCNSVTSRIPKRRNAQAWCRVLGSPVSSHVPQMWSPNKKQV